MYQIYYRSAKSLRVYQSLQGICLLVPTALLLYWEQTTKDVPIILLYQYAKVCTYCKGEIVH